QKWHDFAHCDYYARHGRMMPENWKEEIGARHCRPEPCQSDRSDLAGGDDARPSWREAGRCRITRAIETVLREPKLRTRDLGGAADTQTCGKAIAELLS